MAGIETTGPSVESALASCRPVPWKPVSEEPIESVKTAFGKCFIQRSFTDLEKIAALDLTSSAMMPGDTKTSSVTVENDGSAQLRYAVSWGGRDLIDGRASMIVASWPAPV